MIKNYLNITEEGNRLYEVVTEKDGVSSIKTSNILIERVSEDSWSFKFKWNSTLNKKTELSICDLHELFNIYRIILSEDPSWRYKENTLFKAEKIDAI